MEMHKQHKWKPFPSLFSFLSLGSWFIITARGELDLNLNRYRKLMWSLGDAEASAEGNPEESGVTHVLVRPA